MSTCPRAAVEFEEPIPLILYHPMVNSIDHVKSYNGSAFKFVWHGHGLTDLDDLDICLPARALLSSFCHIQLIKLAALKADGDLQPLNAAGSRHAFI